MDPKPLDFKDQSAVQQEAILDQLFIKGWGKEIDNLQVEENPESPGLFCIQGRVRKGELVGLRAFNLDRVSWIHLLSGDRFNIGFSPNLKEMESTGQEGGEHGSGS